MIASETEQPASVLGVESIVVDQFNEAEWSGILESFADTTLYQTWAYGEVRWGRAQLSHLALLDGSEFVAAAQVRIVKVPVLSAGIAYLRWGPLCRRRGREEDSSLPHRMFHALRQEYCVRRGLSLQIIPNAFSGTPRGEQFEAAFTAGDFRPQPALGAYRTFLVDLAPDVASIRKNLHQKWRNQLNRAEKNGLELEVSDSQAAYDRFLGLYDEMWRRKQFDTTVDVREFRLLQERLGPREKMKLFLASAEGELVGALVCSSLGDTALYVLGATNERARDLKAAYFLQWQAMLHFKEGGAVAYDLGGANPEANPGGYHFKQGFGGADVSQIPPHTAHGALLSRAVTSIAAFRHTRRRARSAPQ